MKFAHLADCHIGGWREEELKKLSIEAFSQAIDICIKENVGFVLIAGDLFNTSLPQIDLIKDVAYNLNKLKETDIETYIIPGSHDYSPSGKTMIDVLEKAGLCKNVFKFKDGNLSFTVDKTNTKITGIIGLKRGLEKKHYEDLNKTSLEKEKGFKIFMFHTLLNEFKPKDLEKVEGESYTLLPKNFNYYAGGHPHFIFNKKVENYGIIAYPGPLFPNNFRELEKLKQGGFLIVDNKLNIKQIPIKLKETLSLNFNADNKLPNEIENEIMEELTQQNTKDKILTLRVEGCLKNGKISDINFKKITDSIKDAYSILKNTYKLTTKEFEEIKVESGNVEEVESSIIEEHLGQIDIKDLNLNEKELIKDLFNVLNKEKNEGEKNADFEIRLEKDILQSLNLEEKWK